MVAVEPLARGGEWASRAIATSQWTPRSLETPGDDCGSAVNEGV